MQEDIYYTGTQKSKNNYRKIQISKNSFVQKIHESRKTNVILHKSNLRFCAFAFSTFIYNLRH